MKKWKSGDRKTSPIQLMYRDKASPGGRQAGKSGLEGVRNCSTKRAKSYSSDQRNQHAHA